MNTYCIYDKYSDLKGRVEAPNKRLAMIKYFKEHSEIYGKNYSIGRVSRDTGILYAGGLNKTYGGQFEQLMIY